MGKSENRKYPVTMTVKCKQCGCFVEAVFRTLEELDAVERTYCGKPCYSRHAVIQPRISKVYKDNVEREPDSEYIKALRKQRGLREEV